MSATERIRVPLEGLWPAPTPIVGMVHLAPLPGAPGWAGSMDAVLERAVDEACALEEGGLDGVLVENYGDSPFHPARVPAETVAAMAVAVGEVVRAVDVPVGVNVLRNDASAALAVAVATGARFIRVNVHAGVMLGDQGWLVGRAHETLRLRERLGVRVAILADVLVKHAAPPAAPIEPGRAARDLWRRGLADGLIVSGEATGESTDPARLRAVRAAVPEAPVWVGSGVTERAVEAVLPLADGAIVGSALQQDGEAGAGVEPKRVAAFMRAVERVRAHHRADERSG